MIDAKACHGSAGGAAHYVCRMDRSLASVTIAFGAVALAPALSTVLGRVVRVPVVVVEIILGVVLGPSVLGWVQVDGSIQLLARLGLAMLFFLAGREIDFGLIRGRPLLTATAGWLISLAVGVGLGVAFAPSLTAGVFIGICLTSTALGTIMPVLRDSGLLTGTLGRSILASGTAGQFGPLLGLALFLSGRHVLVSVLSLLVFAAAAATALHAASRPTPSWLRRLISGTLTTSGQFAVRLVLALLALLVALGIALGLDLLLGAFVAGVVVRTLLADIPNDEVHGIDRKLEAVGFGFVVPFFFLRTGLTFDLRGLFADRQALLLLPVFVVLLLLVRGIPSLLAAEPGATWAERGVLLCFSATGLAIIVAVTGMGVSVGALSTPLAAALVGAGMVSVLLFPVLALTLHRPHLADPAHTPTL